MPVPLKSFNTLVQDQIAVINAASTTLTDFEVGSILRALTEGQSSASIWIQALISAAIAIARLQTSYGNDVDTFVQQFGYTRQQATASTGVVTFSRSVTTTASNIPASSTVISTSSATPLKFTTVLNTSHPNYDPATNSYVMDIGVSSISNIPVQCNQTGLIGNVQAGQINSISSPLVNVNNVTNPIAFDNGSNTATDTQTKSGFVLYLQGLSKATYLAIAFAVVSTPFYGNKVTRYQIVENKDTNGNVLYGFFFVVVDDGSGSPSSDMINAISANVSLYRGLSIMWSVIAPVVVTLEIVMDITLDVDTAAVRSEVTSSIKQALLTYINTLPIGGTKVIDNPPNTSGFLYYSNLFDIIYNSNSHIINVSGLTIDSGSGPGTSDVPLNFKEIAQVTNGDIVINFV